jgi:hypothetical protein
MLTSRHTHQEGIMAKSKTAKSAKKHAVAKTGHAPKAHAEHAANDALLSTTAREAFDRFVHAAADLPASALVPFRSADPALARTNVQAGVDAVMPLRVRIAHELPAVAFANIAGLPDLALALQYASRVAETAPSANEVASNLSAAHALRGTLLTIADGLSRAGLLPGAEVAKIKKGRGALDAAADCVELSELFTKHEKKIAGKHAATAQMLKSANEVGSYLLSTLKSSRAKDKKPVNGPALEARDRLWSLLVQRHKDLRRVAYYIWDDAFNEHVPALLAHKRNAKPAQKKGAKAAKAAPATNGATAASPTPA